MLIADERYITRRRVQHQISNISVHISDGLITPISHKITTNMDPCQLQFGGSIALLAMTTSINWSRNFNF